MDMNGTDRGLKIALLLWAGVMSLFISILHLGMIFSGAPPYQFFRAGPEMVHLAESGSVIPGIVTFVIAMIFLIFSLYALNASGFGRFPFHLPMRKQILLIIGLIFAIRGSIVIIQIPGYFPESEIRDIIFSLVSLLTGVLYFLGWKTLYDYERKN